MARPKPMSAGQRKHLESEIKRAQHKVDLALAELGEAVYQDDLSAKAINLADMPTIMDVHGAPSSVHMDVLVKIAKRSGKARAVVDARAAYVAVRHELEGLKEGLHAGTCIPCHG